MDGRSPTNRCSVLIEVGLRWDLGEHHGRAHRHHAKTRCHGGGKPHRPACHAHRALARIAYHGLLDAWAPQCGNFGAFRIEDELEIEHAKKSVVARVVRDALSVNPKGLREIH